MSEHFVKLQTSEVKMTRWPSGRNRKIKKKVEQEGGKHL